MKSTRTPSKRNLEWGNILLFLAIGIFLLWRSHAAPIGDFANYYYASRLLLEGRFEEAVYEPYAFNLLVQQRAPEMLYVNYTPVPPVSLLFYFPSATLEDVHQAKCWFGVLGLVLFLIAYGRLIRTIGMSGRRWVLLTPAVCFAALWNNFFQGQSYLLLLACILEGYGQWKKGNALLAGLAWALPVALKLFPVILLLFPIVQRDWKVLGFTLFFSLLFSVAPALALSPAPVADYFGQIVPRLFRGEINDPFALLYQSGRVLLNKALVYDAHLNPSPVIDRPALAAGLYLVFQIVVLSTVLRLMYIASLSPFTRLALALTGGLLLTGYGSSYGLLLLLPLFLALPDLLPDRRYRWPALLLLVVAIQVPVYRLRDWPLLLQFPRLYALLGVLLLAAMARHPLRNRQAVLLAGVILLGKAWIDGNPVREEGAYYLPDDRYGIIYQFRWTADSLQFDHLNAQGIQHSGRPVSDSLWHDPLLQVRGNQIFYGERQLTRSDSRKRLPVRLNETEILYLTDEKRGVGFYTLRKIKLP